MRSFFYHYNKPASRAAKKPVISVHYAGTCHLVNNVLIGVPTWGKIRKIQPYFVICGRANSMYIEEGVAIID